MSTYVNDRECAIHEKVETWEGENPFQCFECGHIYVDDQAFIDQYVETFPNKPTPKRVGDILFCPLCLHD